MFRYKLRTLLIVLAVGPMVLAEAWWTAVALATSEYGEDVLRYFAEAPIFPWE
jgi:hypothetical protein